MQLQFLGAFNLNSLDLGFSFARKNALVNIKIKKTDLKDAPGFFLSVQKPMKYMTVLVAKTS